VNGPAISLAGRLIGVGQPVYVVAELSGNHGGHFEKAAELVRAAAAAGADAVKLQTYTADTITLRSDAPPFRIQSGTLWDGTTLHELYSKAFTPWEWHPELFRLARESKLQCFSTPFDHTAVDFLEGLGVPAYKVASFELVDLPLIRRVAGTGKPLIMSTGMATLAEIAEAVEAARGGGATEIALLVCSSAYPSPPEAIRLERIRHLAKTFDVVTGLSDHTLGTDVAVAAVALGACIVEKHLCMSRAEAGPDTAFSLEPKELRALVRGVRTAERAIGRIAYGPAPSERASLVFRRSLFVAEDVKKGESFTDANVRAVRPAHGLHTRYLADVLGRRAAKDIAAASPLAWDMIEGAEGVPGSVVLRPARVQDARLLFAWTNDPRTRAASFDSSPVQWDPHLAWLSRKLADPTSRFYVGVADGVEFGVVRFDGVGGEAELSFSIAPEQRGRKLAGPLVARGTDEIFRTSSTRTVRALIKRDNVASLKTLERLGFERAAFGDPNVVCLRLKRNDAP
jgi:N-acetylneuraminate synthase